MECVFACDVGTSTLKAALVSAEGLVLNYKRFNFSQRPSATEWLDRLYEALHCSERFSRENKIKILAICISGNGPSLVCVSKKSDIEDRLFLWNEDCRDVILSTEEKEVLKKLKQGKSIFLPRIFLFAKKYKELFEQSKYLFSAVEYLAYKLGADALTFLPEVRYDFAYWNARSLDSFFSYDEKIRSTLFEALPPFVLPGKLIGMYKNIPLVSAAPDFFVALIGTASISPYMACDRAGSTEGLNVCLAFKPDLEPPEIRLLPSLLHPNWNVAVLLGQTGSLMARFKDIKEYKSIERILPKYKELSSFVSQFKNAISKIEKIAGRKLNFTLTGGQAENEAWNQFKADISGRNFLLSQTTACELLGDAVLAFLALKQFSSASEACKSIIQYKKTYTPKN